MMLYRMLNLFTSVKKKEYIWILKIKKYKNLMFKNLNFARAIHYSTKSTKISFNILYMEECKIF